MKNKILISSLILTTGFWLSSSTWAATENDSWLPPEFNVLSESDLVTLASLTDSERDNFLESKGIHRPDFASWALGDMPKIELSESEKAALGSMTDSEREAFFTSKGLMRPESGSGTNRNESIRKNKNLRNARNNQTESGAVLSWETSTGKLISRADRLKNNQIKIQNTRIQKIQGKVTNGGKLTRLEKVFARKNNIDIGE